MFEGNRSEFEQDIEEKVEGVILHKASYKQRKNKHIKQNKI